MKSFIICTHQICVGWLNQGWWGKLKMQKYWQKALKGGNCLEFWELCALVPMRPAFLMSCCSCPWVETVFPNCGHHWTYWSSPRWYSMNMESHGRIILTGENQRSRSAPLSTINPTCTDMGANPGLCHERPATNHPRHGMALETRLSTRPSSGLL
jgi:hypothetical protein